MKRRSFLTSAADESVKHNAGKYHDALRHMATEDYNAGGLLGGVAHDTQF